MEKVYKKDANIFRTSKDATAATSPGQQQESAAEHAAVRECHEEIAQVPTGVVRLGAFYPTPGYCDELMIFFRLTGLKEPDHEAEPDEDENIETKVFTLAEARQLVQEGNTPDMKTAFGLTLV